MKTILVQVVIAALLMAACTRTNNQPEGPGGRDTSEEVNSMGEASSDFDQRMQWWRDAGFGMFIHWGAYAVPGGIYKGEEIDGIGEWIMDRAEIPISEYKEFVNQFNPVQFDADAWVKLAKDAGMKYIVITSKHHDGFCLWDSDVSDYDIMDASPFKRDILAELKQACEKQGVRLCFYHSIMDWAHPAAQAPHYHDYNSRDKINPNFGAYRTGYLKPQIEELITKYKPHVLWFDGEWIPEWTHEHGVDLYNYIRNLNPDILVNNRVDKGRKGMQGMNASDRKYVGDFGTPEQEILEGTSEFDWEACMTMNDSWGFKQNDHNWKPAETLIHNLVDIAAKGGNYLLNVGPTPEGTIPGPSIERLEEIAAWMKVNSEIIHGSRGMKKFSEGDNIRYVRSADGNDLYVVSLGWPGESFSFSGIRPEEGSEIYLLGHGAPLEWSVEGQTTTVGLPEELQEETARPCKYAFVFKVNGSSIEH